MIKIKTSEERRKEREREKERRNNKIAARITQLMTNNKLGKSDAVFLVANEYNLSIPTIYKIKKEYGL